jgi:NADPH2:quinone reductase
MPTQTRRARGRPRGWMGLGTPGAQETMRAAAIDRFGRPQVLTLHQLPVPSIEANEVLIGVDTAGVAQWDADMRAGWWPSGRHPRFPLILGTDGSGIVAAVGKRVRRLAVGDLVYGSGFANPKGGFYAQYVAVAADNVAVIPDTLDLRQAGAIAAVGLTALQGIDDALHLRRGDTIIVHGASGGVGTLAVQFAKLRGARVLASASGDDGVSLVKRLGADVAVDGRHEDIALAAKRFAPSGVDAVLALAGGVDLRRCLDALRAGGRVAYPNGVEPPPRKRRGIKVVSYDGDSGVSQFQRLSRAVDAVGLKVPIDSSYPLAQAAKAHQRLAQGHVLGKVVLRVR